MTVSANVNITSLFPGTADGYAGPNLGGTTASIVAIVEFGDTTAKDLFTLPKGAYVTDWVVEVVYAFNDGATNNLDIGITGDEDYWANNLAVGSTGVLRFGASGSTLDRLWVRLNDDTTVNATYTPGTSASAGLAKVTFTYVLMG